VAGIVRLGVLLGVLLAGIVRLGESVNDVVCLNWFE